MQFNTYIYMLLFLPVTILGYFVINKFSYFLAKIYLASVSMFFYAYAGLPGFQWLVISIIFNYLVVLLMKRIHNKVILWIGIIFNIVLLFYFKYTNFTILTINDLLHKSIPLTKMVLPIGISFFTFQQITYIVDSYRGKLDEHSLLGYINYVTFFPKILMGPLVSPNVLLVQFHDVNTRKISSQNMVDGIQMFIIGLFKKVILADTFAKAVAWAWRIGDFKQLSSMDIFLVMLAYTFQIYFDFSGYSDMAIGLGKVFGFHFLENFNYPYISKSITEFWRRWHISLGTWFKEYLYIPLGGNRKSPLRTYVNLFIVFLSTGIWHGAKWTFIIWGLWHGIFIIIEKKIGIEKYNKKYEILIRHIYTFLIIIIGWIFFRAENVSYGIKFLKIMFGISKNTKIPYDVMYFLDRKIILILLIGIVASINIFKLNIDKCYKSNNTVNIALNIYSIVILILSYMSILSSTYNPFIYFRF